MYIFSKIRKVVIGKFKSKWFLPKTRDYKLFLGFGTNVGFKNDYDYIIIPEKMAMKLVSGHASIELKKLEKEEDRILKRIGELSSQGNSKNSPKIKKLRKMLILLEKKRRKIDPTEHLIGKSLRLVIQG